MILSKENMNSVQNSRLMAELGRPDTKEWKHKEVLKGNEQVSLDREEGRDCIDTEWKISEKKQRFQGGMRRQHC